MGFNKTEGLDLAEEILQVGKHNLLLVPHAQEGNTHRAALIAVTTGEPGKDDILFAGRLVRHVGAQATLLSVLENDADPAAQERSQRFLDGGIRSLEILGVPAQTAVRVGPVSKTIAHELAASGYDLLVLGTPLADLSGHISLKGVVEQVMAETATCATMLVRATRIFIPRARGRRYRLCAVDQRDFGSRRIDKHSRQGRRLPKS